jgi:hypothetical protein
MPVIHDPFIINVVGESMASSTTERRSQGNRPKASSVPGKPEIKYTEAHQTRAVAECIAVEAFAAGTLCPFLHSVGPTLIEPTRIGST